MMRVRDRRAREEGPAVCEGIYFICDTPNMLVKMVGDQYAFILLFFFEYLFYFLYLYGA